MRPESAIGSAGVLGPVTVNELCVRGFFRQHGEMLDVTDYELVWPPKLFVAEAGRLLSRPRLSRDSVDLLLREAFREENAAEDLSSLGDAALWGFGGPPSRSLREALTELAGLAHRIRRSSVPRPYWPQRHGREEPGSYLDAPAARRAFADLVGELDRQGYLDQAFPRPCVDRPDEPEPDPAVELEKRLGISGLWPLAPEEWDDSTFYGLVEVYHDLVARPRERNFHDFSMCGWHYSHFSATAGREVYRWKANELLQAAGISYRLANTGEDQGRLTVVFDDGRSALLADALSHAQPDAATRVPHAIALFRKRGATDEDKRSALITLAGVLEERRQLIKAELGTADEGALFNIANRFAIRHQNKQQLSEYDPAFLDWVFWWYLGTVELTSRIITRQQGSSA
jgi:hypothetical protein